MLLVFICACVPEAECDPGSAKCEGRVSYNCGIHSEEHSDVYVWTVVECGVHSNFQKAPHCLTVKDAEGLSYAICASQTEPYQQCQMVGKLGSFCLDENQYACQFEGYARNTGRKCP